jgi:hypothetical protein
MAVKPGIFNFTVQRSADHVLDLVFKDGNDAAIDLTGWTVTAQVWNEARSTKYADFAVTYTDRSNGSVKIALSDEDTVNFIDELYYDVLLTDPNGLKEYYLEGVIFTAQGYTR